MNDPHKRDASSVREVTVVDVLDWNGTILQRLIIIHRAMNIGCSGIKYSKKAVVRLRVTDGSIVAANNAN